MSQGFCCAVLAVALFSSGPNLLTATESKGSSGDVEDLIRHSTYIFKGEVEKLHASNLKILPATDRTALIRVEQVLHAAEPMVDFTGLEITVELAEPNGLKPEQQAIFFTNGWLYGENLAVKEVGHMPTASSELVRKAIPELKAKMEDEKVEARIRLAALVIVGEVAATRSLVKGRRTGPISEHSPDWWVATIRVESTLKGKHPKATIEVLYPNSKDERWVLAPKFHPDQEGMWFLQTAEELKQAIPEFLGPAYVALDPLDFYPKSESARIRQLIAKHQR